MRTPLVLLKYFAKALGNALGGGVAGDLVVDVLPEVCKDAWEWWGQDRSTEERKGDVEAVARAAVEQVKQEVGELVLEFATEKPPDMQEMISLLLTQVPSMVRKSLRRPSEPTGTSLTPDREPKQAEDLLSFLPPKPPRFKHGVHPLPGVDWELVELLGVGGFGEVWKARNPHMPNRPPAALKFCLDSMAAKVLRNEAAVLDRVMREGKHPGIVELLHTYLNAETPCLEYEFVEGGDLAGIIQAWHRSEKDRKPDQIAKIVLQLADIVGFAHKLNPPIVHRDLKPANILVKRTPEGTTTFKIADFGIGGVAANQILRESARGTTQGRFLVSAVRGSFTPLYASPQQMRGDQPDPRDDVHALGVIWYQMLTNSLNKGRPGGDKYKQRLTNLGMTPGMIDLLGSCFEDEPDDRPDNAAVLAQEIRRQLAAGQQASPGPKPVGPGPTPGPVGAPTGGGTHTGSIPKLVRGWEYFYSDGAEEVRVRLLNQGPSNSRVIRADGTGESFKVPNIRLRVAPGNPPVGTFRPPTGGGGAIPELVAGREYIYSDHQGEIRVKLLRRGPNNSRVIRADGVGDSFKVPNTSLKSAMGRGPVPMGGGPVQGEGKKIPPLIRGRNYLYDDPQEGEVQVTLLNQGPANSRVVRLEGGESFVVPNISLTLLDEDD